MKWTIRLARDAARQLEKVPRDYQALIHQALSQLPYSRRVRFTIDWTSEADQHLLIISLVVGRRAVPIYWQAYSASVLKGRMARYERAVIKRAFQIIVQYVALKRIRLTADRGFADVGV